MAKIRGPLHSIDASGSIGKAFFFSNWKRQPKANKHFIPRNPRTINQQAQRAKMTQGIQAWRDLTQEQKQEYNNTAKGLHMSGYNYFLSEYFTREAAPYLVLDGLVAWWRFDEGAGIDVKDEMGVHDGTLTEGSWATGKSSYGLNTFQVTAPDTNLPAGNIDRTISWWMYCDSFVNWESFFSYATVGVTTWFNFYMGAAAKMGFQSWGNDCAFNNYTFLVERWYYIVFVYTGANKTFKQYVDGNLEETKAVGSTLNTILLSAYLGKNQYGQQFRGTLDEMLVYNRALELAEIRQNMNL